MSYSYYQPQFVPNYFNAQNFIPQQVQNTQQNNNGKIILVANKEEATGTAVDLINGTPSFFYNKSNGEIYLKQFDIPTGKGIFKTYKEIKPEENTEQQAISEYDKKINYLINGMDNLHRMLSQLREKYPANAEIIEVEPITIDDYSKTKTIKKRGQ